MPGDVLFTRYNGNIRFVGAAAEVVEIASPTVFPDKLIRVRPHLDCILPAFLTAAVAIGRSRDHIQARTKSAAGQIGISGKDLKLTPVPIPPLPEQHRIVAKVDALQVHARRAREALNAISGLEQLLIQRYTTGWPVHRLGAYIEDVTTEIGDAWSEYPAMGLSNEGRIIERREPIGVKSAPKCKLVSPGDIVFNPIRFSIGSIARFRGTEPVIVSPEYRVIRPTNGLSAELLARFLRTPLGLSLLEIQSKGSVRYRVYFKHLAKVKMPIAPAAIQDQAEAVFSVLNDVADIRDTVENRLDTLDESILAKAFRGELVPQDPHDEPASVLLARIRQERATAPGKKPRKG